MSKKIYVTDEAKNKLAGVFKVSRMMVWKALNFESNSLLARKIRYVALSQYGGVPNWKSADMETTHEEASKTMTQTFGDRVKLVVSKGSCLVTVFVDGEIERKSQVSSIPEFMELQSEVSRMALSL
ncbi:MAG: hypothetical protein IKW85_02265 [Muribaculaceae bacterium]|nr:hypothetical protein [Muribaculaceae bacterium]